MKIKFKIIFLIVFITCCILPTLVLAEARAPQLVVIAFVEALQKNDMDYLEKYVDLERIQNQPRHSYSIEDLKRLFGNINIKEIECNKPSYDPQSKTVRINMLKPLCFNFDLQHQNLINRETNKRGKGDFYRIISIHP